MLSNGNSFSAAPDQLVSSEPLLVRALDPMPQQR